MSEMASKTSWPEIIEYLTDPASDKYHLLILQLRPGVQTLAAMIEFIWFPPGTPANDLLGFRICMWRDLMYFIVSIPKDKLKAIQELAVTLGLKIDDTMYMEICDKDTPGAMAMNLSPEIYFVTFPGSILSDGTANKLMYIVKNSRKFILDSDEIRKRETTINADLQIFTITPQQAADYIYGVIDTPVWRK